jgi:hypothetical protein
LLLQGSGPWFYTVHDYKELPIVRILVVIITGEFLNAEVNRSEIPETVIVVEETRYGKAA